MVMQKFGNIKITDSGLTAERQLSLQDTGNQTIANTNQEQTFLARNTFQDKIISSNGAPALVLSRADTQIEFQNDGTGHAMLSSFMRQNPPNTTNECAWSAQAYNAAALGPVQIGAFYCRWQDTNATTGYSVIGMHANWDGGGSGQPELEVFGNHGILMFGGAAATPPGGKFLQIVRTGGLPSLVGVSDLTIDAAPVATSGTLFLQGYNAGDISACLGGGSFKCVKTEISNIKFPATQVASADANTLDDYEEGSWTPVGNGITFTAATGRYTKIGNVVHAWFNVTYPSTANTSSGDVTGLPFTCGSFTGIGSIGYANTSFYIMARVDASGTSITFLKTTNTGLLNSDLSTSQIIGYVCYQV